MAITIEKVLPTKAVAKYARPISSPSVRLDTGTVELNVALYVDAQARFAGAEPLAYERHMVELDEEERAAIALIMYQAMQRRGIYADGEIRDPDPEKETEGSHEEN